jgi:hypothetical protein
MTSIEEMTKKLEQTHVISFELQRGEDGSLWAGYSPSTGKYFVAGQYFETAIQATTYMHELCGLDSWKEFDECIDREEEY